MKVEKYDVVIIGKGPAGISAALYTVRAGLKTLVLGSESGALAKTSKIENYYGFENPVSGAELLEAGWKQARRLGVPILSEEVTALEFADSFLVKTVSGEYSGTAVLIATGQAPSRPSIPGIPEFEGKGVSYCTTCDGFFYKGKTVGILGSGNYAVQEAMELLPFTKAVTIFTNGKTAEFSGQYIKQAEQFKINTQPVLGLKGGTVLEEILLQDGVLALSGLFVAAGTASSVDFALKLGVSVRDNAILTEAGQKTNLSGIFAAGDCTGGFKQISTAVGQGALAGRSIIEYVRKQKS